MSELISLWKSFQWNSFRDFRGTAIIEGVIIIINNPQIWSICNIQSFIPLTSDEDLLRQWRVVCGEYAETLFCLSVLYDHVLPNNPH